jgi:transcriptional regulator with XRE-family HTH domain
MAFRENLTILRGLHNLSNAKAAGILGFSQQTLSEWQSGKQAPSWRGIKAVAEFFEVPVEVLVDGTPQEVGIAHLDGDHWASVQAKIAAA